MGFDQTLSAELPPPRDDEPPSLRQDILDELADHLACAYRRELLRGADPNAAHARVLEQFGDPAAVARRLWFDAMKGKIMAQRVLIGTCLLLVVMAAAGLALMRQQSVLAQRQIAEANAQLAQALAQSQATNQQMLKQLQIMAEAAAPGQSPDWIPVSFKLTQQTLDGPPAVGCEVALGRAAEAPPGGRGSMGNGTEYPPMTEVIHRVSDDKGLVDFGVVRPGDWQFDLVRSWNGSDTWHCRGSMSVLPGIKIVKSIVCPKAPPDTGPVTLRIAWPEDLAAKNYLVEASFTHDGVTFHTPLHWTLGPNPFHNWSSNRALLAGSWPGETKVCDLRMQEALYYWQFSGRTNAVIDHGSEKDHAANLFADLRIDRDRIGAEAANFDVGGYTLNRIAVLRRRPPRPLKVREARHDVLAFTFPGQWGWSAGRPTVHTLFKPPDELEPPYSDQNETIQIWSNADAHMEPAESKFVEVSGSYWNGNDAHFVARSGTPSIWTIQLPDEIVKVLRAEVKTGDSGKPSSEPR